MAKSTIAFEKVVHCIFRSTLFNFIITVFDLIYSFKFVSMSKGFHFEYEITFLTMPGNYLPTLNVKLNSFSLFKGKLRYGKAF